MHLYPSNILLPDFAKVDGSRYAVVACDQFTSEPAVWEETKQIVGDAPSALNFILPELYLSERAERIPAIHEAMTKALSEGQLVPHENAMIYLRRTQSDGSVREGIVGAIDLLDYDYRPGTKPLIRATEGTVLERVPPRVDIRRGAAIELPHVMLLSDDHEKTVIEPLADRADEPLYDFDLMQGGGHVTGYLIGDAEQAKINDALDALTPGGNDPLLFAVGDGNHSLAAAKAYFEELCEQLGDAALSHPARYALVEVVNLHSPALVFRPIYRAVFGADPRDLTSALLSDVIANAADPARKAMPKAHLTLFFGKTSYQITYPHGTHPLDVGTLQAFLDRYLSAHPGVSVDYIHGEEALASIVGERGAVGFLFPGMEKEQLFPAIVSGGALPRKTFSMGEAHDKRYYLEARGLTDAKED